MIRLEAILLCDLIVRGPDGKHQLQGMFDIIRTSNLPAQHRSMWLYFRFYIEDKQINGGNRRRVSLRIERSSGEIETIDLPEAEASADGKVEGVVEIRGFQLRSAGRHQVTLYFGDESVGSYRFNVVQILPKKEGEKRNATTH